MDTTSYGYRLPETGDTAKGTSGWYASIEFDIQRLNDHSHNGVDSVALSLSAFVPYSQSVTSGSWSASGGGYRQLVTVPAGIDDINNYNAKFIFTAPSGLVGEVAYLNYDRQSASTYYLYCNDNTAEFTVIYR